MKVIISGGGTGGHIFPAVAIANALKQRDSNITILFVGASGKMEMEKVPKAGYKIKGLPIRGFQRGRYLQNISALFLLAISLIKALFIVLKFKPNIIVGVGGYASGAITYIGSLFKIPVILQEQNSYAGITNKLLSKKATKICVAYKNMDRYFPKEKILFTGNPVRKNLLISEDKRESYKYFELDSSKQTVLILGGSLGAKTINECIYKNIDKFATYKCQFVWQVGKLYYKEYKEKIKQMPNNIVMCEFINDMNKIYSIADLVVTRSGAGTISELCLLSKPSIFIPSPNVAEDHQTKNAMALVDENAALIIKDENASKDLPSKILDLLNDSNQMGLLATNIYKLGKQNSDELIVDQIIKYSK